MPVCVAGQLFWQSRSALHFGMQTPPLPPAPPLPEVVTVVEAGTPPLPPIYFIPFLTRGYVIKEHHDCSLWLRNAGP